MKKILIYFIVLALLPMVAVSQEREIKEEGKTICMRDIIVAIVCIVIVLLLLLFALLRYFLW